MKTTVVMCTYNGEKYLKEQLDSIACQTVLPDELIVCDDCSVDNTVKVLGYFQKSAPFKMHINVNEKNLGVTKNFEQAVSKSSGDIIFFCDQDDKWAINKIERHLGIYRQNENTKLVFSNAFLYTDEGISERTAWKHFGFTGKKKQIFKKDQFNALIIGWFVTGATMSVRRDFAFEFMPYPKELLHDMWLSLNASLNNSMCAIDEKLTYYHLHANQVMGSKSITFKDDAEEWKKVSTINLKQISEARINILKGKISFTLFRDRISDYPKTIRCFMILRSIFAGKYKRYTHSTVRAAGKDFLRHKRK